MPAPDAMAGALRPLLPHFRQVDWLACTGSTNADLLARARHPQGPHDRPWLLGCHLQTRGRGRAGRTWHNRAGANLMFSCAFDALLPLRRVPVLSPLLGLAACEALRRCLGPGLRTRLTVKWPNDLLWDGAKLAGILIESVRAGTGPRVIVVGMGLNLQDAPALSTSLDRDVADWVTVAQEDPCASALPVPGIVSGVAEAWRRTLAQAADGDLADLPRRYACADALRNRPVDVLGDGRRPIDGGIACGIDRCGRLLLHSAAGTHAVSVGEISVRVRP